MSTDELNQFTNPSIVEIVDVPIEVDVIFTFPSSTFNTSLASAIPELKHLLQFLKFLIDYLF